MAMLNFDIKNKAHIYQLIAGITAVTLILIGCLVILAPFFAAILLALILALSAWPAFMWLKAKLGGRVQLASLLMTIALALCFVVPLTIIGTSSADNFSKLMDAAQHSMQQDTGKLAEDIAGIPYVGGMLADYWRDITTDKESLQAVVKEYAGITTEWLMKLGGSVVRGLFDLTLGIMIAYFFFLHGARASVRVSNLIERFGGDSGARLLDVSKNTLIGVVYGMLGTALAQGTLAALGFWIADVPGATFLGLLTFFLSFIPNGPPFLWVPAALWLYSEGEIWRAVFMGIWGLLVVSTIDNLLRPYFISLRGNQPFLLVLMGVVGGVIAFGFIGIFIGPTLLALAYALVTDWSRSRVAQKAGGNIDADEPDDEDAADAPPTRGKKTKRKTRKNKPAG